MNSSARRPKRGLGPEDALARWSDPEAYGELVRLCGGATPATIEQVDTVTKDTEGRKAYLRKREAVEAAFLSKLSDGNLGVSAMIRGAHTRAILPPSIWDVVEVDYWHGELIGEDHRFIKPEFFDLSAIPLNAGPVPDWIMEEIASLTRSKIAFGPHYETVSFKGIDFTFGKIQAKIIRILHEASQRSDPWRKGKEVLEEARSNADKMSRAFRGKEHWERLIESRHKGMYRLRVDRDGFALPE